MVDARVVAITACPRRENHSPGCSRMDRRPVWNTDVDSGMEPAPAVTEGTRDGTVDRPDKPLCRRGRIRRTLCRRQLTANPCVGRSECVRLVDPLPLLLA